MHRFFSPDLKKHYKKRLIKLYGKDRAEDLTLRLLYLLGRYGVGIEESPELEWNEQDAFLITYGDSIINNERNKLATLCLFLNEYVKDAISTIHILPFFPYSSDDGFSVIDYRQVREDLGDWGMIRHMARGVSQQKTDGYDMEEPWIARELVRTDYSIMADLVVNHVSRKSSWFRDFVNGVAPARDYFIEVDPDTDLSHVTRPRSTPLLTEVPTQRGAKHLWTTFSDDQIDLDFSNPDVLFEFLDILLFYISQGVSVIRLDAIAYLWKEIGTSCIHLEETHEVVRLMRDIVDTVAPHVTLITETNVPHKENISYFGDGDEAHMVYQFSLPPLLLHAIQTGNATYLTDWAEHLDDPPEGCHYFNFTASHDGIGVRPLEGLVPDDEFDKLVEGVEERGGYVSYKSNPDGSESPYELNITYFDAFSDPESEAVTDKQIQRYLCSQNIMMSLKGIPAVYIHSLIGTRNDSEAVEREGYKRAINRTQWRFEDLKERLDDADDHMHRVNKAYIGLLNRRKQQKAFHPDGAQHVFDLGKPFFAFQRVAPDVSQSLFVVANVTGQQQTLNLETQNSPLEADESYHDLLSDKKRARDGKLELEPWEVVWLEMERT